MVKLIEAVRFTTNWRKFAAETEIRFEEPFTVIVGSQGSGKSSLLWSMGHLEQATPYLHVERSGSPLEVTTRYFDGLYHNPQTWPQQLPISRASRERSLGESILELLSQANFKRNLLLMDEPTMGLTLSNTLKVLHWCHYLTRGPWGNQVVVATNNVAFIEGLKTVYWLDKGKYCEPHEYLKEERNAGYSHPTHQSTVMDGVNSQPLQLQREIQEN